MKMINFLWNRVEAWEGGRTFVLGFSPPAQSENNPSPPLQVLRFLNILMAKPILLAGLYAELFLFPSRTVVLYNTQDY